MKDVWMNLYIEAGKKIHEKMLEGSDVVVGNFRPGVMERMGCCIDRLKEPKPDIIHFNINGFGTSGPYRDRPAFDFIAQAMSGFMSLNGGQDDPPMRVGPPISDLVAGINGALGILAALLRRTRTGRGESLSVSLLNSMIGLLSFQRSEENTSELQ